jgi:hypothetical protein
VPAEGTGRRAKEADLPLDDHFCSEAFLIETEAWQDYLVAVGFGDPDRTLGQKEGGAK